MGIINPKNQGDTLRHIMRVKQIPGDVCYHHRYHAWVYQFEDHFDRLGNFVQAVLLLTSDSMKELAAMHRKRLKAEARKRGKADRAAGVAVKDCPYPEWQTEFRLAWMSGWLHSKRVG